MKDKVIGELFGVDIYTPILVENVREALNRQFEFTDLLKSDGLTEDDAQKIVADCYDSFCAKITEEEKRDFDKIYSEESILLVSQNINQDQDVGELYGVLVEYPFNRKNIRKIVRNRSELAITMVKEQNISTYQASNDLEDILDEFIKKFGDDDQTKFYNLMADELEAQANELNDIAADISRKNIVEEESRNNLSQMMLGIIVFVSLLFFAFVFFK